jgi:hypothetical protein
MSYVWIRDDIVAENAAAEAEAAKQNKEPAKNVKVKKAPEPDSPAKEEKS